MLSNGARRFLLTVALIAAVTHSYIDQQLEPEWTNQPSVRLEPEQLSVEGVKLGWTLEQIEERHGPSREELGLFLWGPEGLHHLSVDFDKSGHANYIAGHSLEYSDQPFLQEGASQRQWVEKVGHEIPSAEWNVPMCAYSTPQTNSTYHYLPLELTILAASKGRGAEPQALKFILHSRVVIPGDYNEVLPYRGLPEPLVEEAPMPALPPFDQIPNTH